MSNTVYSKIKYVLKWPSWVPQLVWSVLVILIAIGPLQAQKKKKKGKMMIGPELEDSLFQAEEFNFFEFKNVNRIPYYYDEQRLERIAKLNKENEWEKLYKELREYIRRFAVQNFYKDTYLIWRLAKLTELYGDPDDAKALYRLVLRHHHEQINLSEVELYYDTLNNQQRDQYVPLEYYYELVEYRQSIDTLIPPRGVLLNMGRTVNSRKADYGPTISMNDNVLVFTSKRNEVRRSLEIIPNEDLFYSVKEEGIWMPAEPYKDINSEYNEGSACLSRDGRTLYFSRCESPDSYGSCDLFVAIMQEDSTWGEISNLGTAVNSVGWDSHPSLSHTEDTLYFASDRIGGFGLSDIYFTYKKKDGTWARSQNVGPVINTRRNDVSPFYHPKHNVLYFSSNGQLYVFGEYDIYKTYQYKGAWSEPKNIGPLVNGYGNEFYFSIDSQSKDLFYAKSANRDLNRMDLYSFPLPMEAQPGATTPVRGSLVDSQTGKPFSGIVSIIDVDNGVEVAPKFLNDAGRFEFDLINNRNYLLIIQGDEFFRIEEMFFLDGPMEFNRFTEPIASRVKFASIEFENGRAELKTEMFGDLNKIINFMYDNPDFKLKISGHTDSVGDPDFNMKLSMERANAIMEYIVVFGSVEPERVEAMGYGHSHPLVDEQTEEDRALNRRVEFEIYRPAKTESGNQLIPNNN